MDAYKNIAELRAREHEGLDFRVWVLRQGTSTVILAPHGGGIEPGTSEIARRIAGTEFSVGVFEGMKRSGNACLHISSAQFDEPRCLALVQSAETVVTVHGEGSSEPAVYVGGRDDALGHRIKDALHQRGYAVRTEGNPALQGLDPMNICNRGLRQAGVQLELSAGLRKTLFASLTADGRKRPTPELDRFADAVRQALLLADIP